MATTHSSNLPPAPAGFILGRPDREWFHEPGGRAFARALGIEHKILGPIVARLRWAHRLPRPRPGPILGADQGTAVPAALREARRWIVWRHLDGRKPPVGADGRPLANWNDPSAWMSYEEAVQVYASADPVDGVGFVLGAGFAGLDLDEARDPETGALVDRAEALLSAYPDAYAEWSPSGKGVKVFVRATDGAFVEVNFRSGATDLKASGYFTVTGDAIAPARVNLPELKLAGILAALGTSIEEKRAAKAEPLARRVAPGSQEPAMFREACRLRRLGFEPSEIANALWGLVQNGRFPNEPGREPWTRADCEAKGRAVAKYDPAADTFEATESGHAEYFAAAYADALRYDHAQRRWLVFDGHHWRLDKDGEVDRLILDAGRARQRAAIGNEKRLKAMLATESESSRRKVEKLARSERPLAADGESWNRSADVLAVENGVVDLRSGAFRPGTPEDAVTLWMPVAFDPAAECPHWRAFVETTFKDRPEMPAYIQRVLGYALTAEVTEQCFWILYGEGANGKSTLIETVMKIVGPYGWPIPFPSEGWQSSLTEYQLAALAGRRFVFSSEGSRKVTLNDTFVKDLSGGDTLNGRHPAGRPFEFRPVAKMFLRVNKKPVIRDRSHGMWRKVKLVEFRETFAVDPAFAARFDAELPGILNWMLEGARSWFADGLRHPKEVETASAAYRGEQDELSEFIGESCTFGDDCEVKASELFAAYQRWADARRIPAGDRLSVREFGVEVGKRYERDERTHLRSSDPRRGVWYLGLGLAWRGAGGHQDPEPGAGNGGANGVPF